MKKFKFLSSLGTFVSSHKIIAGIALAAIAFGGYEGYVGLTSASAETQYAVTQAARSTMVVTVSGTGQVSPSNQVSIKPKVSGTITSIKATDGQVMKSGDIIASIDASDAYKSIRDAQANLESAQLTLEKLTREADALSILQAENSLVQAEQTKASATDDLTKAYDDGFTNVANAFLDLPSTVSGLNDILYGTQFVGSGQYNIGAYYDIIKQYQTNPERLRDAAADSFKVAKDLYDQNLQSYKNTSRSADRATIEALILETYETTRALSDATKDIKNLLDAVHDTEVNYLHAKTLPSTLTSHEASIQSYTSDTNSHLQSLSNITNTITSSKNSIINATASIEERTASLTDLKDGPDELDVRAQEISIQQRKNSLIDAQEALADYTIRAPFDGILSGITVKKGDEVSSATEIASFLTAQKYAEITLNEVDAVNVKVGQKATATFDAVTDLTVTGQVMSVDSIGTVSQGVVTYTVKILFDTQDDRVKSGMSVSVSIITEAKSDIIVIPAGAIKTAADGTSYVEVFNQLPSDALVGQLFASASAPVRTTITTGITNDTETEVVSGLSEGDYIVTKTSVGTTVSAVTASSANIGGSSAGSFMMMTGSSAGGAPPGGR